MSKTPFGVSSTDCGPSGRVRAPPPSFSPCHGRHGWGRTDRSDPGALKPAMVPSEPQRRPAKLAKLTWVLPQCQGASYSGLERL